MSVAMTRPGKSELLVDADAAVDAVFDQDHDDRQVVLTRRPEFVAAHLEIAVARERDDRPPDRTSCAAIAAGMPYPIEPLTGANCVRRLRVVQEPMRPRRGNCPRPS